MSRASLRKAAGSAVFASIGAWAAWEARAYGLYEFGSPAPGLFPFVFAILLLAIALLSLTIDLVHARSAAPETPAPDEACAQGSYRVFGYLGVGMVCAIVMNWIGFFPAALFGVFLLVRAIERMSWRASFLTALGSAVAADLLFVRLLAVPLPAIAF